MNREDITNMAKEAGLTDSIHVCPSGPDVWIKDGYWLEELWHLATLVAAEKDKEIARLREENVYLKEVYEDLVEDRKELFDDLDKAVAAEREAVGNIILDYAGRDDLSDSDESLLKHLFELIRARGET